MQNVFSVDVEGHFHVSGFADVASPKGWSPKITCVRLCEINC